MIIFNENDLPKKVLLIAAKYRLINGFIAVDRKRKKLEENK